MNSNSSYSEERVSAVPPILSHMLGYGLSGGLMLGIIGLFAIRYYLEGVIFLEHMIPASLVQQIAVAEIIALILGLGIMLLLLRFRWQAPSWKAKFAHGFSVGFVFLLTSHAFLGAINGALYNRELWQVFFRPYTSEDAVFLQILSESVWQSIFESMQFQILLLMLIPIIGGLLGLVLLRRNPELSLPVMKDAFTPVASALLPIIMYIIVMVNIVIFVVLGENLAPYTENTDISYAPSLVTLVMVAPPFFMAIVLQIMSIISVIVADVQTLHRKLLRLSQIVVVGLLGITVLFLTNFVSPGVLSNGFALFFFILSMALAWTYGVAVQWKLYKFNPKCNYKIRATWGSLVKVSLAVFLLMFLLVDYFSTRISVNLVLYTVPMIPTTDGLSATIQEIFNNVTIVYWGQLAMSLGIAGVVYLILTTPFLWISNRLEK